MDQIFDMWHTPDHRYFNFLGSDRGEYIIRHDTETSSWELTYAFPDKIRRGVACSHFQSSFVQGVWQMKK